MALRGCIESEREQSYCADDTCPTVFNLPQSNILPCTPPDMEGISGIVEPFCTFLMFPYHRHYASIGSTKLTSLLNVRLFDFITV